MLQTSVEIVNPGGTGRPALVISARPEPLPPSRSFMLRLPSALPFPKKYTCFFAVFPTLALFPAFTVLPVFFFAINDSVYELFRCHLGDISNVRDHVAQRRHQCEPGLPQ